MKILQKPNSLIFDLLSGSTGNGAENYKLSQFAFLKKINESFVLFNTLTRELLSLSEDEFNYCKKEKFQPDENNPLFCGLRDKCFLVPEETDELKRYKEILSVYRCFQKNSRIAQYKIFTTTFCNARCFYCFEEGMRQVSMTEETAENIVKYILKTSKDGQIVLYWFGGEPLCNIPVIDYICTRLNEENKPFISKIITNGYLLDEKTVKKARELWKLEFAQITLDGTEDEHNKRKAYVHPAESPYTKTLRNIELLLKAGVKVISRLNFDENNVDNITELLDLLAVKFRKYENFRAYPTILSVDWLNQHSFRSAETTDYLHEKYVELIKKSEGYGFSKPGKLPTNPKPYYCMAANPLCATISAEGDLYTCQSCDDKMRYGDVVSGITKPEIINSWHNCLETQKKCDTCKFLPECSTFNKCPDDKTFCALDTEFAVERKIRNILQSPAAAEDEEEFCD